MFERLRDHIAILPPYIIGGGSNRYRAHLRGFYYGMVLVTKGSFIWAVKRNMPSTFRSANGVVCWRRIERHDQRCAMQIQSISGRPGEIGKTGFFSGMSIVVGSMLLATTENAHAYRGKESHELWHKQATATPNRDVIVGKASWYGQAAAGRKTATGERLDPNKLTAASTQLPLQSRALVTDLENGRSVCVRINDCGPYTKGRKLDVSKRAAEKLDMAHSGTAPVKIKLIATPPNAVYCARPAPARGRKYIHFHRRIGALTN